MRERRTKRAFYGLVLLMLLTSMLVLTFGVERARAVEAIYIRDDGLIDPPDSPIFTFDNLTYALTGDVNESIVVERNNVVIDGSGYVVTGTQAYASTGVDISGRTNVTIKNVEISAFDDGILLFSSFGISIIRSNLTNNQFGVRLAAFSNDSRICENNFMGNAQCGIWLGTLSEDNLISLNEIVNNKKGIGSIDSDVISGSNIITGNNITNNEQGVMLGQGNNIMANQIANNYEGVILGRDNSISENDIKNNTYGIRAFVEEGSNAIECNNVTNNVIGFELKGSGGNIIFGNNVTANTSVGIRLEGLWWPYNMIFHNNFANSGWGQVSVDMGDYAIWDNGYPSGGNYWSNYVGTDIRNGPSQNERGSDGIGDTPHLIDTNNVDHYPLMHPWSSHAYMHDIAVVDVAHPKTVVGQGHSMNVNVSLINQGSDGEGFPIVLSLMMSNQNGTHATRLCQWAFLASGFFVNVTFTVDTASFDRGNYTVDAYATPVLGEINTTNNDLDGGWVFITIPGDVNGDGKVNLIDTFSIALAFGNSPGGPRWNPDYDLNDDGKINLIDCFTTALSFGKSI